MSVIVVQVRKGHSRLLVRDLGWITAAAPQTYCLLSSPSMANSLCCLLPPLCAA